MIVISNSTALVHLSAMGRLDLLQKLFGEIRIADEVYQEVVVQGAGKPGAQEVKTAPWIKRETVKDKLAVSTLSTNLGLGESATIILAVELGADLAILDDRSARLQAQALGLNFTGTVGILLMADEKGMLNFRQSLDDLLATGFRLNPREYNRIVQLWQAKRLTK